MADCSIEIIEALRRTANRLEGGDRYEWGHMGRCNCGHLVQTVTGMDPARIHAGALRRRGDWNEQLDEYCPQSGLPLDSMVSRLLQAGFTLEDLAKLERLSDAKVIQRMGPGRALQRNRRQDAVDYLRAWADLLEEKRAAQTSRAAVCA